jgi:hypothetical protein
MMMIFGFDASAANARADESRMARAAKTQNDRRKILFIIRGHEERRLDQKVGYGQRFELGATPGRNEVSGRHISGFWSSGFRKRTLPPSGE